MLRSRFSKSFSLSGATGPLIGLLLLCAFLSFATELFFSLRNFVNILDQITVLGILSVASILALCGLVASGRAGLVSGVLIAFFRVPAFIATLAMMSAARGLSFFLPRLNKYSNREINPIMVFV